MNETTLCVVGNVATRPVCKETALGTSARFRLAVTSRYWDREKNEWTDGHTNFFTVWSRRTLAANVTSSVSVGDPVIVQGRLRVRTERTEEGESRTWADIDATAIGHDLARGTSAFRRGARAEPNAATATPPASEPNWHTASASQSVDAPQHHRETAGVT
ncbi:single-stranded DNA-binding protein [Streptomyces poonensis]|uniref:Single-stranded DNA-binding protein n=1 Tax=Streptomyces poonensis TaxID=68255 RepID=A0A918UKX3_9ACTN|nr:single-stranded DNA-binding protein [Streptomyces poonensis]GGZ17901.1 single-stranded DNA-binding protein 1 [Streptomyces poonensis]GLJ91026.1 single-stranded DNA-binding protein 1 [Streptomyces poonensis]